MGRSFAEGDKIGCKGSLPRSRFLDVTQRSPKEALRGGALRGEALRGGALRDIQKRAARETTARETRMKPVRSPKTPLKKPSHPCLKLGGRREG